MTPVVDPGEEPGGADPSFFLDQTEARRAEKSFLIPPSPAPSDLKVWIRLVPATK